MNTPQRCDVATSDSRSLRHRLTFTRRCVDVVGWLIPSALLMLIPKCPVCFASYIAIATGLGISVAIATYLRPSLLILCVGTVLFLAARQARRLICAGVK